MLSQRCRFRNNNAGVALDSRIPTPLLVEILLAELTSGRMIDGRTDSLSLIFKQIRGYQ
ncbi:MAG: hypothetical protein WAM60_15255 [Candidatus Promineifilaceae bacterium]